MDRSRLESTDNWFQKEKERESKLSVWELDGAKYARQEHEDDCDRKELEREHIIEHNSSYASSINLPQDTQVGVKAMVRCFVGFFIIAILCSIVGAPEAIGMNFLLINPGIFIVLLFTKGKPYKAVMY